MKSLFQSAAVALIVCAITSPSIFPRDLVNVDNYKDDYYTNSYQTNLNPEIDWPVWIGVQQTNRVLASFDCEGIFGFQFNFEPSPVPEWTYRAFDSPPGSDVKYLHGGAIWVGGIVNGDTLVSVGADGWYSTRSMFPTSSIDGYQKGSVRSFEYSADYSLRAEFSDTIPEVSRPDRTSAPLNIVVALRSHVWRQAPYDQAIIYDMVITNIGPDLIESGFIGLYMDADVCYDCNSTNGYADDVSGTLPAEKIAYIIDNDGDMASIVETPKAFAVKFLHTSFNREVTNFNWWASNGDPDWDYGPRREGTESDPFRDFEGGGLGTPVSPEDKYYIMSHSEWDFDQIQSWKITNNDPTWITQYHNAASFSQGHDTRFLISTGPYDLEPDSSVRIFFTTFTGENIHSVAGNAQNLPDDPDLYLANLDFSDLIASADYAEMAMNFALLNPLSPTIGLHIQTSGGDSAVLEWDPWVLEDVVGYAIYFSELDHAKLPYPGLAAPWLTPDDLSFHSSVGRTYKTTIDNLIPEQFYFARVASRTLSTFGTPSPPEVFTINRRAAAPGVVREYTFYLPETAATIKWQEPPGIDIDHYNIYRFDNTELASLAYHAFYDQGRMSDSIAPKDEFNIGDETYFYYAMTPYATVDSTDTSFTDIIPVDEAAFLVSAVSKRGFESEFSPIITTSLIAPKDKDYLLFTNSKEGFTSFAEYSDIVNFYQTILSGYDYDFYDVSDTLGGGICQPVNWPCIDWHDLMRYRFIIIDDKLHDQAWTQEYEDREFGFTKYLLSGGRIIYFGAFNGLREVYLDDSTGSYPINNQHINRFFGIDTVYTADLTYYAVSSSSPFIDSLFGFISADSVLADAPSIAFDPLSGMFTSFIDVFWPSNTAPVVAAFHPSNGSVTHTYNSLFPSTSLHHGKAVGIRTQTDFGLNYLFGFHLWYMNVDDAAQLIRWITDDIVTAVDDPATPILPQSFLLRQNYPNPFNPTTTISFELPKKSQVDLDVFNILGRKVKTLHSGVMPAGTHSIDWNSLNEAGENVTSGIYFYRLRTDNATASKKMILLK